jgi:8-oxo-dGTP pyrophosphatase MutT (NUDIX family)
LNELDEVTVYARTLRHPNLRPKDAATLIVVDRTGNAPKVLLGKRHHTAAFMPGKYVFPGGRVDLVDQKAPFAKPLNPLVEINLMQKIRRPSKAKARAIALTAIRETFEETGLIIGSRHDNSPLESPGTWREFCQQGYYPDLSVLHLVARAITPPRYPRRFDARFFTVDATAIVHRIDGVVHGDAELVKLKWLAIGDALLLDLPDITRIVLHEIGTRISAGFRHDLPVPFFRTLYGRFVRETLS